MPTTKGTHPLMHERNEHSLGAGIRRCRMRAGLTMGDLARALKVAVPVVSDIERGVGRPPSRELLAAAIRALGRHVDEALEVAAHQALTGPRCFSDCYPRVGDELAVRRLGRLLLAIREAVAAADALLAAAYRIPPGPLSEAYAEGGAILVPMERVVDFRRSLDGLRQALLPDKSL